MGFGTFPFNNVNGAGASNVVLPDLLFSDAMDTSGINNPIHVVGGVLTVDVTAQNLTGPLGLQSFVSNFTTTLSSGGLSLTEQTFRDMVSPSTRWQRP
jgi:hypothetical protein